MVACVIPAYKASTPLLSVVDCALAVVDRVVVVDDACPFRSGELVERSYGSDPRVTVVRHQQNRGVGGAMKSGFRVAMELGASIVVKVDADGQMDPRHVPNMLRVLHRNPDVDFVKGNRFIDASIADVMPGLRLLGNSGLTLLVRVTTGYWGSVDPTNGFFAVRAAALPRLRYENLSDRYYFEISLLAALGMRRCEIAEIEIPAIYGPGISSLSIAKTLVGFPFQLLGSFTKRLVWRYVIADMNVGSLFLGSGLLLTSLATFFGALWWREALRSGVPRTAGTVTLALAPLMMGFQLLLNALLYDVQFAPRVLKVALSSDQSTYTRRAVSSVGDRVA